MTFEDRITQRLARLGKHKLYRVLRTGVANAGEGCVDGAGGEGYDGVSFVSNDYLNLRMHPDIVRVARESIQRCGVGSGSAPLLFGYTESHELFERQIARFKGKERALLFGSGYLANISLLSTLAGPGDLILSDALNHASIFDGIRLSRACSQIYPHGDVQWLWEYLGVHRHRYTNVFVVTDAIFSMDGDIAPLDALYDLTERYELIPILDEAHSTGVLGKDGRGIESHYARSHPQTIIMGTLGKALGSYGAFVTGRASVIEYLINKARPFIYSTALPPGIVTAAQAALELIENNSAPLHALKHNIHHTHQSLQKLTLQSSQNTPIFPIRIGPVSKTLQLATILRREGFLVAAIRPPSVAHNTSRLRISIQAHHKPEQIDALIHALTQHHKIFLSPHNKKKQYNLDNK